MQEFTQSVANSETFQSLIYAGDLKLLYFLIILMFLDIMTGLVKGWKDQKLRSRKALFGYARKVFVFFIIILANIIDQIMNLNGGLVWVTIIFYIANEALSIIENCSEMGVIVPKQLSDKLSVIRGENEKAVVKSTTKEEFTDQQSADNNSVGLGGAGNHEQEK